MPFSRSLLLAGLGLLPAAAGAQSVTTPTTARPPLVAGPDRPANPAAHYQPATYPGGIGQLARTVRQGMHLPTEVLRTKTEGQVVVAFRVDETGKSGQARIVSSSLPLLNAEMLRGVQALGPFTPALQDGRPVSSTFTLPMTFRFDPMTGPAAARPTAVQPLARPAAGSQVVEKLVSFRDSTYWTSKSGPAVNVHQHYFTYDRLGRPATHTRFDRSHGHSASSQVLTFKYDAAGRLVAKANAQRKYTFHYSPTGRLSSITGAFRTPKDWMPFQEITLTEKSPLPDGTRPVTLTMSIYRDGAMTPGMTGEYLLAPDNTLLQASTQRVDVPTPAKPRVLHYAYDTHPNPLSELLPEDYYTLETVQGLPHNRIAVRSNGAVADAITYDYNAAGLPTQAITRNWNGVARRTQTFTYAPITVPAPAGSDLEASLVVTATPNPASAATVIRAAGIGPGEATLRLLDAATGQVRRQTVHPVAGTFEETVSVVGLEPGVYVVEVSNGPAVAKGRLVVE